MSKTVFSAVQPTGKLHLGNYLGAFKQWLSFQQDYPCIFSVVDLHAMTIDYDPKEFNQIVRDTLLDFLAMGIDPTKSIIFIQSYVPEHAELAWILNTLTPIAELERMTQYKDKARQHRHNINAGLFDYPVLMAADILLYKAELVPVGEDQVQHVELARDIAKKFNKKFGDTFPLPKVKLTNGARVMSLADPTKKMSKSLGTNHHIALTDDAPTITKKVMSAVTDSGSAIKAEENRPALTNLLTIFSEITNQPIKEIEKHFAGRGYKEFKEALAKEIITFLAPFQNKRAALATDPRQLDNIITTGAAKASKIAKQNMTEIRKKTGLR